MQWQKVTFVISNLDLHPNFTSISPGFHCRQRLSDSILKVPAEAPLCMDSSEEALGNDRGLLRDGCKGHVAGGSKHRLIARAEFVLRLDCPGAFICFCCNVRIAKFTTWKR